jgi:hypothetical protein
VLGAFIFIDKLNAATYGAAGRDNLVPDLDLNPPLLALLRRLSDEPFDGYCACQAGVRRRKPG